ncbi:MAG: hypothetical protein VX815_17195 [Gemmatimonadota bacterium]|nr:hypothetical protein [Gemmatimonadota bacterium]
MTGSSWFLTGLFLVTGATLLLELLDTRLLSVVTWYHLSFFAVSAAMFGMAAGALRVYLDGDDGNPAARLATSATRLALSIPLCHAINLALPVPVIDSVTSAGSFVIAVVALAVPFYLSGISVALALTRIRAASGRVYAADLAGAAAGALAVVPLLGALSLPSGVLVCGAAAAAGAACLHRFAASGRAGRNLVLAAALLVAALVNDSTDRGLRLQFMKGRSLPPAAVAHEFWTIHGHVMTGHPFRGPPPYWGAGKQAPPGRVGRIVPMLIDGAAGTSLVRWSGDPAELDWVAHDITAIPYHLRPGGSVAIAGVGGGRDVLTAIASGATRIAGIEINSAFIELLSDTYRDEASIVGRPEVELIHDDARAFLARTSERFDIIQISLIDTWAATGAGAFTLSENGLYTLEAFRLFLDRLNAGGVLSVSRWYSAEQVSETSRLVALATGALLDRGIADPRQHLALIAHPKVATLLVAPDPFTADDDRLLERLASEEGFQVLLTGSVAPAHPLLGAIASSRSPAELEAAVADQPFDYSVPTDERPYFFNLLNPVRVLTGDVDLATLGIVADGNLLATVTLALLWLLTLVGVAVTLLFPLWRTGRPTMAPGSFGASVAYFAGIGAAFMLVQIPLVQRFSVYLGHPTYTIAGVLFSMILAAGIGSALSDRLAGNGAVARALPAGVAALLLALILVLQPLIEGTIGLPLSGRLAIVVVTVGTIALPMGMCFPLGLRWVRSLGDAATPWMWGINGATGVLASVSAVGLSMWLGISWSLMVAVVLYAAVAIPARRLAALSRND